MKRVLTVTALLFAGILGPGLPGGSSGWAASPAVAQSDAEDVDIVWSASLNGVDAAASDENDPADLLPDAGVQLALNVSNKTARQLDVRSVSLSGSVLGLTFFSYTTRVDLRVASGDTGSRTFQVDLTDLQGQATGLLPARLQLLDGDQQVLAERTLTVDVQASLWSIYGVFGLVVAAATVLLLLRLLMRLAAGTLPGNRWRRATRFGIVGVGLGLSATFTLSALSIRSPDAATWVTFVVVCAIGAFTLGYLSPDPTVRADEDDDGRSSYAAQLLRVGGEGPEGREVSSSWLPGRDSGGVARPAAPTHPPASFPTPVPASDDATPVPDAVDPEPTHSRSTAGRPPVIDLRSDDGASAGDPRQGGRETVRGQRWPTSGDR